MIVTRKLSIQAGTFRLIDIDLEVGQGEYAVLMGRTGCGKTTILETICGLRNVSAGRIELRGRDVTDLKPAERDIGYVPQDLALFSTMTVREQLAFAPRIRAWPETEIEARVTELAELLGISALLDRHPTGLSGGEMPARNVQACQKLNLDLRSLQTRHATIFLHFGSPCGVQVRGHR